MHTCTQGRRNRSGISPASNPIQKLLRYGLSMLAVLARTLPVLSDAPLFVTLAPARVLVTLVLVLVMLRLTPSTCQFTPQLSFQSIRLACISLYRA